MERWKLIADFIDYEVSDQGRLRRAAPGRATYVGKIIKQRPDKDGYLIVTLHRAGKKFTRRTSRLTALAFIDNFDQKSDVNHKNGIKVDNRVVNLEWSTRVENQRHAASINLMAKGERNGRSKLTEEDVRLIRDEYKKGDLSGRALARKFGTSQSNVSSIVRKELWGHIT